MALALSTRRPTIAAIASILVAVAVAAAVAGRSCNVAQPGPEAAVRDMLEAARSGDHDTVFALLSPATQQRLEAQARHATDLVGAMRRYTAKDLVSIGSSANVPPPTDITMIESGADRAVVELVSPAGRSRIHLVRVDGRWRIDIPDYGRVN